MKKESLEARLEKLEEEVKSLKQTLRAIGGEGETAESLPSSAKRITHRGEGKKPSVSSTKSESSTVQESHFRLQEKWLRFERVVGERWLVWIGAFVFAAGFGLFLKYAFEQGWINEIARFILGFLGGILLVWFAEFLYKKKFVALAQGISGLGLVILYLSIFTAYHFYHILSVLPAFILFFCTIVGGMTLAMIHNSFPTAFLSIFGAFATPILLANPTSTVYYEPKLFSYLFIINIGVLYVSSVKKWRAISFLSFICTIIYFTGWYMREYTSSDFPLAAGFVAVYFILFSFMSTPQSIIWKKKSNLEDVIFVIINPLLFFLITYSMLIHRGITKVLPLIPLFMAVYYFILSAIIRKINKEDSILYGGLMGTAIGLLTLPVPMIVNGYWITVAWGVEAVALIFIGSKINKKPLRIGGLVIFLPVAFRLFIVDSFVLQHSKIHYLLFFNIKFFALFLSTITFAVGGFLLNGFKNITKREKIFAITLWSLFFIALFWILNVDLFAYFSHLSGLARRMSWTYSTILWSFFLLWLLLQGILKNNKSLRITGFYLMAATAFKIIFIDEPILYNYYKYGYPFLFNVKFLANIVFLGVIFGAAHLYGRKLKQGADLKKSGLLFLWTTFVSVLFLALNIEITSFFSHYGIIPFKLESMVFTSIFWSIFSFVLILYGVKKNMPPFRIAGLCLATLTFLKLVIENSTILYPYPYGFPFLINLKFASSVVLLFTLSYAAMLYATDKEEVIGFEKKVVPYLWSLFLILLFIELHSQASFSFYRHWQLGMQRAAFAISLLWVLYGFGLLIVGIVKRIFPLRIAALTLFGITLCKVIIIDLRFTDKLYKMFALLGIGAIFIIAAYFYRKYRQKLKE
ncbi:MAG: hypothetical protein B5M53_02910 [Candidatus Cloacimonas sp. 4484_209]|nr:MAG: hypothetical protein B5M53_02910 [Candidatus Cloacimonas sp. 4484_209]